MRIVVGLGNPGRRYARTRHNVGFMVVEHLAERWNIALDRQSRGLRFSSGRVAEVPVILVEPRLYMNASGEALRELPTWWCAADLIVVHDDIDLDEGRLRVRRGGGTAGHRGLESIAATCGREFDRVRVGVGRPPAEIDAATYVLMAMSGPEWVSLCGTAARGAAAVECLLSEGLAKAMNRFNARVRGQEPDSEQP